MNKKDGIYLESYSNAVYNQMLFDRLDYISLGEDINDFAGLPRPSKWMLRYTKLLILFKGRLAALRLLWTYFFGYVFCFLIFLVSIFSGRKSASDSDLKYNDLALVASQRSVDVISQAMKESNDFIWLVFPRVELRSEVSKVVNSYSLLGFKDKLRALVFSFKAHFSTSKNKELSFQTYTAYDWCCVAICIEKLKPKKLIMAQHLDRWAILADAYIGRNCLSGSELEFHLVQHGIELEKPFENIVDALCFNKLKNVTNLYVYDECQSSIFTRFILDGRCGEAVDVEFFNSNITLYEVGYSDKIKVMFVGHSICEDLHAAIYLALSSRFDFDFYYKPHPTTIMSTSPSALGWTVVDGGKGFPRVNYLISYESTLVGEYKRLGVESFIHEIGAAEEDYNMIIESAEAFFLNETL